jgi:mono/diheme cytochrome c family protein
MTMKSIGWGVLVVLGFGISVPQAAAAGDDGTTQPSPAERGKYLAAAGNCVSCHTRPGGKAFAGGRSFKTPFGTLYSTNITPDAESGIGLWSEQQFANALRKGVRPSGEHLYPAFPYPAFTKLSDQDVSAVYDYLKTLKPVSAPARPNELRFPYNQRWAVGMWNALYFKEGRFVSTPEHSAAWNRGKYLVEGPGHCGACHTTRNFLGAENSDSALTGGAYTDYVQGKELDWSAPNLTSASSGLALWSDAEIASYLKLGVNSRAGVFGPMNEVVVNSTRYLTDSDLNAMATYLKSLTPNEGAKSAAPDAGTIEAGSLLYDVQCGTCHLPTGLGSSTTGPPLVGSPVTLAPNPASLINITLYGPQWPATAPSQEWQDRAWQKMGSFAQRLSDEEAAALLSYIRNAWGNKAGKVSVEQVAKQRKAEAT